MASTVFLITMTIMAIFIAFEPTFAQALKLKLLNLATMLTLNGRFDGSVFRYTPNGGIYTPLGDWELLKSNTSFEYTKNCFKLKNIVTSQCLNFYKHYVYTSECRDDWHGDSQHWKFKNTLLVNCLTNRCLDASDAGIYALDCNGRIFQEWVRS